MMAFVGADRRSRAIERLVDLKGGATGSNRPAVTLRRLGVPAARARLAVAEARRRDAAAAFAKAAAPLSDFGGSRAQRDILTMSQIEAAIRIRETSLAQSLLAPRLAAKANSDRVRQDPARCQ